MTKAERAAKKLEDAKALVLASGLFVAETEPTKPVVVVEEHQPEVFALNTVVFKLFQDTSKIVRRKNDAGVIEEHAKEVKHFWEVTFKTAEPIETAPLSEWIVSQLANYQIMQQYQGKSKFDTSLPIMFDMKVNNANAEMGLKFSTNAKTIEKVLTKAPSIMTRVFNPTSTQYTTDAAQRAANRLELKGFLEGTLNATLAERIIDPATEVQNLINEAPTNSELANLPVEGE